MNHARTMIREHLARTLVRNGAWADAVFVSRATPISDDDHFPNVCIYTQSERTLSTTSAHAARQEVTLLIEVRERRAPDMLQPWRHIEGMPSVGGQTNPVDVQLDQACAAIENIVFANFSNADLKVGDVDIHFFQINEINTDITLSGEGVVPFALAQMEFKVVYEACFDLPEIETCPLLNLLGSLRQAPCRAGDDGATTVAVNLHLK